MASALPSLSANPLPLSFLSSLVEAVAGVAARKKGSTACVGDDQSKEQRLLAAWIARVKQEHGTDLPEGTVVLFFRLFFPEEGVRRRYGLQEKTLADLLETVYKVQRRGTFARWALPGEEGRGKASVCLGEEVKRWMEDNRKGRKGKGVELTLGRVDELLDELASASLWSADDVRAIRSFPTFRSRSTIAILKDLLLPLTPFETAFMIQLLLRDLSPLLYPPPSSSGTLALEQYTSAAYDQISVQDAMKAWHKGMNRMYLAVADMDWVAGQVEEAIRLDRRLPAAFPRLGLPVKIPKTEKPGSCSRATKSLQGQVAVETKYDGERLQIHIDLSLPYHQQIRIYSKSGRDSTQTRRLLLPIIRAALSLPLDPLTPGLHPLLTHRLLHSAAPSSTLFTSSPTRLILEGEMVPYDESRSCVDEFWKLDCAKTGAEEPPPLPAFALSPAARRARWHREERESHETGQTGETPSPKGGFGSTLSPGEAGGGGAGGARGTSLHLMGVFFDLLVVGEESLLDEPYQVRRARLESLVRPIEGFSKLSDSVVINFDHPPSALEDLRLRFAHIIAKRCEGLMLKPLTSRYNDFRRGQLWVKLKKDFIPGAGDTLDFHVVGASWQKDRGRELLVPPSVWTTFFIGLAGPELGLYQTRSSKPHLHILFSVSYGLSRAQLDTLCAEIRAGQPGRFDLDFLQDGVWREVDRKKRKTGVPVYEAACASYTFSLASHLRSAANRPSVMFRKPRVMELNGAGFQRASSCPYYELRFPRITKPSRPDESGCPLSLADLQETAQEAMSAAPSDAAAAIAAIWDGWDAGKKGGKGETEEEKHEREVKEWVKRLERADGVLENAEEVNEKQRRKETARRKQEKREEKVEPSKPQQRPPSSPPFSPPIHLSPPPRSPPASSHRPPLLPTTPATPPRASIPLARSVSSPCARSDAPSPPSQRPVAVPRLPHAYERKRMLQLGGLAASSSMPNVSSISAGTVKKKRRLSSTSSSRTSLASLSATLSSLLPSLSLSAPSSSSPLSGSTTQSFAWSIFPPSPLPSASSTTSPPPTPRHHSLDAFNFLASPLAVLWVAGLDPPSFSSSSPYHGQPRQGYVFVDEGEEGRCVEWLEAEVEKGWMKGGGRRGMVWVVKREAMEEKGEYDGVEVLSVLS
ncbi:hypothetical protein JCM8547_004160 [Rhodosporidiobolus lusitaniae]